MDERISRLLKYISKTKSELSPQHIALYDDYVKHGSRLRKDIVGIRADAANMLIRLHEFEWNTVKNILPEDFTANLIDILFGNITQSALTFRDSFDINVILADRDKFLARHLNKQKLTQEIDLWHRNYQNIEHTDYKVTNSYSVNECEQYNRKGRNSFGTDIDNKVNYFRNNINPGTHRNLVACPNINCHRTYKTKNGLVYHLKRGCDSSENRAKPFKCKVIRCYKAFKNKSGLKYHMNKSHGR